MNCVPSIFEAFAACWSDIEHLEYECPKILRDPNSLQDQTLFHSLKVWGIIFWVIEINLQPVMEFSEFSFLGTPSVTNDIQYAIYKEIEGINVA